VHSCACNTSNLTCATRCPVAVLPVNATLARAGCELQQQQNMQCTRSVLLHVQAAEAKNSQQPTCQQSSVLLSAARHTKKPWQPRLQCMQHTRPLFEHQMPIIKYLSGAPASAPSPVTTLSTPAGRPASAARPASSRHVTLASSLGFSTQQLPAASAGATFHCKARHSKSVRRD
jgi:hypothetical protein